MPTKMAMPTTRLAMDGSVATAVDVLLPLHGQLVVTLERALDLQ